MLCDKIKNFIDGCGALIIEKDGGYAFNKVYASPFSIRPETIEKIKKLIYDDLMFTCEETEDGGIKQDIPINRLSSFYIANKIWKKEI